MITGVRVCLTLGYLIVFGDNVQCFGSGCFPGWTQRGQSCYTWDSQQQYKRQDAVAFCKDSGSNLVVPDSAEENRFIHDAFWTATEWPQLWIGLNIKKDSLNGTIVCPNATEYGEELSYCNLFTEGPQTDQEGCGVMSRSTGAWRGSSCTHLKFTMCEREYNAGAKCRPSVMCHAVDAATGTMDGHCLVTGHNIAVVEVKLPVQCCMACFKDPHCRSFNLIGNTSCQLNNATISQIGTEELLSYEGCAYYEPAF